MIELVAILGVFGIGVVFSIIGSIKLKLAEVLQIDDARVGGLISILMFTSIIVILAVGPLVDAFGHRQLGIAGFLIAVLALILLSVARSYQVAVFSCILLGVGGMCMNTVGNTLLPMVLFGGQNAPAASNLGNVFFGVGAFITPLILGVLVNKIGYKGSIYVLVAIFAIGAILNFTATGFPEVAKSGFSLGSTFGLLKTPVVLLASLTLFCYIALEATMGGWLTTYLTDAGYKAGGASTVLSAFWIAVMLSRLGTGMSGMITPENGSLYISILAVVSVISIIIMIASRSRALSTLAVVLTGLAFGPIFPTVVGVTFSKIAPELYGSTFSIIFAVGLLGATTIPAAIGVYARGKSIRQSMVIAAAVAVLLIVMGYLLGVVG